MVSLGHPTVLHAHLPSRYCGDYELRKCCICRLRFHRDWVVLHLGKEELPGTTDGSRDRFGSSESKRRQSY
jgi:hypothetical protein